MSYNIFCSKRYAFEIIGTCFESLCSGSVSLAIKNSIERSLLKKKYETQRSGTMTSKSIDRFNEIILLHFVMPKYE